MPSAHRPIFCRVRWLLLRYKIAPISSWSCLRQKIGPCVLSSVQLKSEWRHPTMRPRLLLSQTISPIKNRSVCADFWSEKKIGPIYSRSFLLQKIGRVADAVREKKSHLHSNFFSELLTTKNLSVCAGHYIIEIGICISTIIFLSLPNVFIFCRFGYFIRLVSRHV